MNEIENIISESIAVKQRLLADKRLVETIFSIKELLVDTFRNGGKVLLCGNGGSASDAQHIAAELSGRFYIDRKPLYAEALHCNTSYMTSVSNDYGYEMVFARLIEAEAKENDVVIGLSTSGNSANIVKAFEAAQAKKAKTIALVGENEGKMQKFADISLNVPSAVTPRIQEAHILIGHIICELVEKELFGNE
ncbi:MAG: D-sedoheptulose 7-phosphate isomerase [Bacteroidales bacterium]|nr:D-sedoheptulose 7-phosphate isomerase [Bacteroidales bacterium]